jgi:uncharacterized protein YvpB
MLRRSISAAGLIAMFLVCLRMSAAELVNLWLDVPFVRQTKDGCGAASIAMVMQYWEQHEGRPAQPEAEPGRILDALYSNKAHGIYATALVHYLQQNGFRTFVFAGQPSDLQRELALGRPLIAALKPEPGSSLHYVVVAGLDQSQRVVLVNDPAQRKLLKDDQLQFEREWKATGNWTLLAVPETSAH